MPDPTLKDHQLEQVEDLESWIIIYLKLMSIKLIGPCRNAGKQGAWHGTTPLQSWRASLQILSGREPGRTGYLPCAQTAL